MTDDPTLDAQRRISAALTEGLEQSAAGDRFRKIVNDAINEVLDSAEYYVRDELGENLAWFVHDCFQRAVEAMLDGNEELFRRHLRVEGHYDAREHLNVWHDGRMFEPKCLEIRRKLVEAYPDLIEQERVKDLGAQLEAVRAALAKANAALYAAREELNDLRPSL